MKICINAIYRATEGEGIFVGTPEVFVRVQGCDVGCVNCDSKETWAFDGEESKVSDVVKKLSSFKLKRVSITGGDPLHPKNAPSVLALIKELKKKKYFINIEVSGLEIHEEIFSRADFISFDLKTPSSGVTAGPKLIKKMQKMFKGKFQVKSVIEDRPDFDFVLRAAGLVKKIDFPWVLTPAYDPDEEFPKERFIDVLKWNEENGGIFRVIGQQHKFIFGAQEKLV